MSISCLFQKEENSSSQMKTRYSSVEHVRYHVSSSGIPRDQPNFILLGELDGQADISLQGPHERCLPSTSLFSLLLAGRGKGTFWGSFATSYGHRYLTRLGAG